MKKMGKIIILFLRVILKTHQEERIFRTRKVFDNYYGSSKNLVFKELRKGKNIVFDIDWQGTRQIRNKKLNYKLLTIFILPPSKKELLKRLEKREKKHEDS